MQHSPRFDVRTVALLAALVLGASNVARGADLEGRGAADSEFRAQLAVLAEKCDELGLQEQAQISRGWFVPRDPRRLYLFLPPPVDSTRLPADASQLVRFWHEKFTELRQQQAKRLFALAGKQIEAGHEAAAYRLLHEVLHEDPEHARARWGLGYARGDRGWRHVAQRPSRRRNRGPHPQFGWPSNRYWQVDSEHFELTTNLGAREGRQVAEYLERVYGVWQQVFYSYWSVPGRLAARLEGDDKSLGPQRTFNVVLFRDQDEYVRQLSPLVPQIGMSTGFYAHGRKTSFFYAGDELARPTWVHESTHQFFQETGTVAPGVGERNNFWVVEGVALYMESLTDRGLYVTTGGADAERLQYARFRRLSEGYYVPLESLVDYGRDQLQRDPDIRKLYSQAAGLTHFLIHGEQVRRLQPFVDYLRAVYRGVGRRQTLELELGERYAQLDSAYVDFLDVEDAELAFVDPAVQSLCLAHTGVTDEGLTKIPECTQLRWLDLSFTEVSDDGLARFAAAGQLDQLNLERTRITDAALDTVAGFRKLQELDLSQTAVTDEGIRKLSRLSQLQILWLTGTQVTDEGLSALTSLRDLQQLDVQSTRVTPAALETLRRRLPKLK
jgi:hypothetical protein